MGRDKLSPGLGLVSLSTQHRPTRTSFTAPAPAIWPPSLLFPHYSPLHPLPRVRCPGSPWPRRDEVTCSVTSPAEMHLEQF